MGILTHLSWRQLRHERGRSLLTIAAMTLAATLVVATLVGLRSLQTSLYHYELTPTGGMAVAFPATTPAKVAKLKRSAALTATQTYVDEGPVQIGQTRTSAITGRLHLTAVTPAARPGLKAMLASGRLPRQANEVLLADALVTKTRRLGSTINVTAAGHRHTYRIVGTTNVYNQGFIPSGGVLRVTAQLPRRPVTLLAALATPSRGQATAEQLTRQAGLPIKQLRLAKGALKVMWGADDHKVRTVQIAVVTVLLVVIGSVALLMIYTSINLAVQAHRQRYGLLRTVGATPAQIRRLVLQESLLLAAPAWLLGLGLGLLGLAVGLQGMNHILAATALPVQLVLQVDWLPLGLAALFMFAVTLLASARPALRASRVTPIEAVRALTPSPRLTARKLRSTWVIRHLHHPLLQLAAIFDRRDSRRGTMLALVVVTVALFVGLTGFIGNFWRAYDSGPRADVTAVISGQGNQTAKLRATLKRVGGIKQQLVAQQKDVLIQNGPDKGALITLYVLSDRQLQRTFGGHATVLNTKVTQTTASGHTSQAWALSAKAYPRLKLVNADHPSRAGQWVTVRFRTLSQTPGFAGLLDPNGAAGLAISTSQFHRWAPVMGLKASALVSLAAVRLQARTTHRTVVQALKNAFGRAQIADAVADSQQQQGVIAVVKLTAWGFIGLLALVCLATVINHTFANLMASRRSLAMLQSIGTTPKQVLVMQLWQYGLVLGQGWLLGSLLGVGLSALLYRLTSVAYTSVQVVWPWPQVALTAAALLVVLGGLAWATWRLLTHQDLDQLIRSTD